MITQQRNIKEKLITFKRIIYGMKSAKHVQIFQKLTQIQMLKLPKCQKRYIIKEEVIETIQINI